MENRVQIRRGIGAPGFGDLLEYELGYDKTSKALYIRSGDGIEIVNSNVIQQFITDSHENGKNHVRGFIGDSWTINENAITENHNTLIHRGETGATLDDKSYLTIRFDIADTYVLSGYVKGTPNLVIELRSLDGSEHLSWTYNVVGINYEYITEIFEIPAPGDYQLTLGGNGTETEGLYFKELQIERGEIPTDWRPAPEDVGDLLEKIKEGERGLEDLDLLIGTKVSEINLSLDGITSRVSNVETHMTTVTPHHIILSNENQSIITDSTGKVTQAITVTTDIDAFKGVNRIAGTIGTPVLKNSAGTTISFGTITKTNPTTNTSGKVTWSIPININISSDSGWIEIPIAIEGKAYTKKLNWTKAKEGVKGDKGDKGDEGKGIESQVVTYQNHTSGTTTPTGSWADSPSPVKGQYLWTRTVTQYTEGDPITTYAVAYNALDGQRGEEGIGISSTVIRYFQSTSGTTPPSGDGATTPPTPIQGQYNWTRTEITYTDGSSSTAWSTSYNAQDGQKGDKGDKGDTGASGQDAITILLSNESHTFAGNISNALAGSTVVNIIAYKGTTRVASSIGTITGHVNGLTTSITDNGKTSNAFTVSATTALKTANGVLTIPITVDGKSFTKNFSFAVSFKGATGSTGDTGASGADAKVITLTASAQIFTKPKTGAVTPSTITVTGTTQNTTIATWQYSTNGGEFTTTLPAGVTRSGNVVTINGTTMSVRTIAVKAFNGAIQDTVTIAKVEDGVDGDKGDKGDKGDTGLRGATGEKGPKGDTGTSVESVTEYYLATNLSSGVTTSTDGWKTTMQTMTSTKKYLWNYEVINFSDGSSSPTIPVIMGVYGDTGATGRSITGITEHYLASSLATGVTRTTSGWKTTMQTTTPTNKYLWNYETITWSSGTTPTYTNPIIIGIHGEKGDKGDRGEKGATGDRGPIGPTGTSVSSVTEYYLATSASSGVTTSTSGWKTTIQTMTATNKYLWNYEQINFSDNTSQPTIPVIIGVYGDKGQTGDTGATGRSITAIQEYYLVTSASTGVTRSTDGWKTTMQTTTPTNKYLWNYEKITWSSGTTTTYVDPIIIGVHGATGSKGDEGPQGDKGDKGTDARIVSIAPSQLYFVRKLVGGNYVVTPDTITLAPDFQNCTFSKWEYSINGTTFTQITRTSSSSTLPYYNTTSRVLTIPKGWAILENNDYVVFKITSATGETDVQTVSILYDVTELETRVNSAEQKITDNAIVSTVRSSTAYTNDLAAKGDKSVLDSAVSTINQHANQIALKVEQTDIDTAVEGVQDQVTDHESRLQSTELKITPNAIVSTVTSNITGNQLTSIISQDSTTVKIKAKYIDLVGAITAESGIIQDLAITNDLLANDISANKISSGVLEVDRLIIRSIANPERSLIYEINNIDGALQAVQGNTLNGEIFTKRSISADRIMTHSVTANEIASKTITSEEIKTGTITAQSGILADAVITSAKIAEAQIDVAHLKSGFVDELLTDKIESKHIKTNSLIGTEFTATSTITVGTDDNVAVLTGQHPDYRLFVGNQDPTESSFSVTQDGILNVVDAEIAGNIQAYSGEFLGSIKVGQFAGIEGTVTEGDTVRFWAGENEEFAVYDSGAIKASDLILDGKLTAENASINGVLKVGEDGVLLDGDNGRISSSNFASGLSGWGIDKTGNAEFNNAKIRGQIESAIFVQNETHVVGGSMLVRPAGTLRDEVDRVDKGRNLALNTSEILSHTLAQNRVRTQVNFEELKLLEGKQITFSFEAKSTFPSSATVYILDLKNYQVDGYHVSSKQIGDLTTEWKAFTITLTVNEGIKLDSKSEFTLASNYDIVQTVEVRNLKIEKGSIATPWTPAPEENMPFNITVENPDSGHYPMFNQDDILRIKNLEYDTWLTVNGITQGEDNYTYTCTVVEGDLLFKFPEGTNIVSYGQTGSGGLIFTSEGENSPYLDIFESNVTPWNGLDMKARLGNLNGITDAEFGAIEGYGLYSDNAYLKGSILLPDAGITNVSVEGETDSPVRFWAGASFADRGTAPFRVLQDGSLYATKGIFEGEIRGATGTFSGSIDVGNIVLDDNGVFRIKDGNGENVVVGSELGLTVYGEGFTLYPDSYSNRPYFSVAEDTNGFRLRTDRISTWKVDRDTIDTHRMVTLEGGNLDFRMLKQNLISDYSFEEGTVYGSSPIMSILPTEIGGKLIADSFTFEGMNGSPSIGIGINEPQYPLDIDGLVNTTEGVQMGGSSGAQMVYNASENSVSFVFFD